MGWWMLFGSLLAIATWSAITLFIVWVIRSLTGDRRAEESPMKIAQRRYARGEISREEYERIKNTLTGN